MKEEVVSNQTKEERIDTQTQEQDIETIENVADEKEEEKETIEEALEIIPQKTKKKFKLLKITIWRVFAYFIIYSIIGFILETIFGVITKGVVESRKSFLYGPFCAVYGLGASVMLIFLKHFEKDNVSLFVGGMVVGTVTEYVVSLFGEIMLQVKWWDYSNLPLNINGRVCLLFSIMWGFLGLFLVKIINPWIDKMIDWLKEKLTAKVGKTLLSAGVILLAIDWVVSTIAVGLFIVRMTHNYKLDVENNQIMNHVYTVVYSRPQIAGFIDDHFGDERLIRNFPDLKITDRKGNIIFFRKLRPDIQPYYIKVFHKEVSEKWET